MNRRHALAALAAASACPGIATAQARFSRYNAQGSQIAWSLFSEISTLNVGSGRPLYAFIQPSCPFSQALFQTYLAQSETPGVEIRAFIIPSDNYSFAPYADLVRNPSALAFANFMRSYQRRSGLSLERDYMALSEPQKDALTKAMEVGEVVTTTPQRIGAGYGTPVLFWRSGGAVAVNVGYTEARMPQVLSSVRAG